jgi:hypothetical protein
MALTFVVRSAMSAHEHASWFKVNVFSREGSSTRGPFQSDEVHEALRLIGLEWKLADTFHDHEVVITITPHFELDNELVDLREKVRKFSEVLDA